MRPCVFCGSASGPASDEHVIPKWARDAFDIQGWVTVNASEPSSDLEQVGRLPHLNIVLKDALCESCNSAWLGPIEDKVKPILTPMMLAEQSTVLDAGTQALVAFWAVKTGLLLQLALQQMYRKTRVVRGYTATVQELAWLRFHGTPPDGSMVWLACWDCEKQVPVRYDPSFAPLPTADGAQLTAHLTTFTLGFVAFQIYTVDFVAAEQHGAPVWNTRAPKSIRDRLPRIWPPPQPVVTDVPWPKVPFAHDEWRRLVTWDERLRPGPG